MINRCPRCGHEWLVIDEDGFCPACGLPVGRIVTVEDTPPVGESVRQRPDEAPGETFEEPTDREWRRFLWFAWGAYGLFVVVMLVLAAVGLWRLG